MHQKNKELIVRFYSALQNLDYNKMQEAYHVKAQFSDPAFGVLNAIEVKAMWQMLLTRSKDLKVVFSNVDATDRTGRCRWEAWYTFSKTGRSVHNIVHSSFEFMDDRIYRQEDKFDVWRWSRQALGPAGMLLGWSPWMSRKVKRSARESLEKFMTKG
jgi:hypothetical protein